MKLFIIIIIIKITSIAINPGSIIDHVSVKNQFSSSPQYIYIYIYIIITETAVYNYIGCPIPLLLIFEECVF